LISQKYAELSTWTKNKVVYINTEHRTPEETYTYCLQKLKELGILK
jgi:hypothetical protein